MTLDEQIDVVRRASEAGVFDELFDRWISAGGYESDVSAASEALDAVEAFLGEPAADALEVVVAALYTDEGVNTLNEFWRLDRPKLFAIVRDALIHAGKIVGVFPEKAKDDWWTE